MMDGLMYRGLLKILNKPHKNPKALEEELVKFFKQWRTLTIWGEKSVLTARKDE